MKAALKENGNSGLNSRYPSGRVSETLTNGFFTIDDKWIVQYWNHAAEKILGVKSADIVGKNLWKEFADIIPVELHALDRKIFLQDNPVHFEEYWGELGTWFDVVTYHCGNTLSVSFKSGSHLYPGFADNAVERLKTLTELYRYVTEITNDCLWEWDMRSEEIFWIDGGHKRIFGYKVENALIPQKFWESRIHPDDRQRVLAGLKAVTERYAGTWKDQYRFKRADGSYAFVHDRGHIIYDDDLLALRMIGATQDITPVVLLEDELEKANSSLTPVSALVILPQAVQKHSALFTSALAHEVRNPLTNISLATELLVSESLNEEQQRLLDIITRGAARISTLVNDLLHTYKEVEVVSDLYSVNALLDKVLDMNADRLELKNVVVTKKYLSEDGFIFVNKQEIKIALINIVVNAIEAMPIQGGRLTVTTKKTDFRYSIEIEDNGIGISRENLKNIFKPFFTQKKGGMGLGLATTMDILLSNAAQLEVQSEEGAWTRFIIIFNATP